MNDLHTTVSIITVNYYSEKDILNSLDSIVDKTKNIKFEYIIVSNSPLVSSFIDKLKSVITNVRFYEMSGNVGFASACNKGAELASGEYLFFLNPDTCFKNDVLERLTEFYSNHQNIGIIGPHTFNSDGTILPSAKAELTIWFYLVLIFPPIMYCIEERYKSSHFKVYQTEEVPIINGHALFIKKKLFNAVKGMDENFFMYWEENDLCTMISKLGKKVVLCTDAKLVHYKGTSTDPYFLQMEIEKHKSQKKFILKHHPKFKLINRISGLIGYFWRLIISIILFRKKKARQFLTLFTWYLFRYE